MRGRLWHINLLGKKISDGTRKRITDETSRGYEVSRIYRCQTADMWVDNLQKAIKKAGI